MRPARRIIDAIVGRRASRIAKRQTVVPTPQTPFWMLGEGCSSVRSGMRFLWQTAELSRHAELSTMLGAYKVAVEVWITVIREEERVSPQLIPRWRSLTIGNKLTSMKKSAKQREKSKEEGLRRHDSAKPVGASAIACL